MRQLLVFAHTDPVIAILGFPTVIDTPQRKFEQLLIVIFQVRTDKEQRSVDIVHRLAEIAKPVLQIWELRHEQHIIACHLITGENIKPEARCHSALDAYDRIQPIL